MQRGQLRVAEALRQYGKMKYILPLFLSCFGTRSLASFDVLRERLRGPIAGGHQGGFFAYWPNTLKNFKYIVRHGIDVLEMDLHVSKDGIPVVYHDDTLDTWTFCKGSVSSKTLKELQKCRFKLSSSAYIPSFEEVLAWANGRVVVDAEFKDFGSIEPAIRLVQKYNSYNWTYFQAQDSREKYVHAHKLDPQIALLYAIQNAKEDLNWALAQDDSLLVIEVFNAETRSPQVVDAIHRAGKLVTEDAWHLGSFQEILGSSCGKIFHHGVDIAISNRPRGCLRQKQ